jgi:predicted permease
MHLWQDIRFAFRTLKKSPVFVVVAVLSLALGIGANAAIFTLVDQLLLRMLPVKHPEQLVQLWGRGDYWGANNGPNKLSYPMYADFRDHNKVFSGMFGRWGTPISVVRDGVPERADGEFVTGSYFQVLGVGAAIGRVFTLDDDRTPGAHPLAVISYRYWMSRFAGSPSVVGRKITVNGYPLTIIGVTQAGFEGTDPASSPDIRVPIMMKDVVAPGLIYYKLDNRRGRWVSTYGRLKPGVSMEQARASLQPFFHQILNMEVTGPMFEHAPPEAKAGFLRMWMDLLPASKGQSGLREQFSKPLLVLMGIVGLVLLIACANVANPLIARAMARQKEIAVRLALGAGRGRIVSQLLVESLILSIAGGVSGLLVAMWMDRALLRFVPSSINLSLETSPDARILLFALGVSLVTGLAFGLIPALQSTRPQLAGTLKDQAGSITSGTTVRLRKALVAAQVALSLLLLIGSGLFIHSLQNLKNLDPGFRAANLLTFSIDPTQSGYKGDRALAFYRQLQQSLDAIPGVQSSSLAVESLLTGDEWDYDIKIEGYKEKPREEIDAYMNFIAPDYFKTIDTPILLGRDFRPSDVQGAGKVCIVNEKFAKKYLGGTNAIGRHIAAGDTTGKLDTEIVGIARDTKYESLRDEVPVEVYQPYQQMDFVMAMAVYVRTTQRAEQTFGAIRGLMSRMDPNIPIFEMKTLERQIDESLVTERLVASLSTAFGFLATLLAAIGLYGVLAYMVAQRTREIGVRVALGAGHRNVVWLVMREVLVLAGIGIGVGLPVAWGLARLVKSQLYGIAPNDWQTIALAVAGITAVAMVAGYMPARRAARIDPMRALRWE